MKRIVATFSGERYHLTTKSIVENSERFGATETPWVYDDHWLTTKRPEHCTRMKWAFDDPNVRGVSWFSWKPLICADALCRCNENDVVLFIDADTVPISDMTPLYDHCDRAGMMLFAACNHSQKFWAKRDLMELMSANHPFFRDRQAGVARFMAFKKGGRINYAPEEAPRSGKSISVDEFLKEWLDYTCDQRLNTFEKSVLFEEYTDGFVENRCEQAILTNLAHKYNIPLHREADQWGNGFEKDFPCDTYPQIFESTGVYSYAPEPRGPGSAFRNIND